MLNIYLTNLGKYNEGVLCGEWLELPATEEEIEAVKQRIGINEYYEEMFITDYETDVDGLTVGEFDDLDELNDLAEAIEDDPEAAAALIYFGYNTAEEIKNALDDVICIGAPGMCESIDEFIGYYYAEECGCIEIPEEVKTYFDYERYGRDIRLEGNFYESPSGNVYEVNR